MNPLSSDIKTMLEAETDLGLVFMTNLFIGGLTESPDNQVALMDSTGRAPLSAYSQDVSYNYPVVDILVRNADYSTGWRLINDIVKALNNRSRETIGTTDYLAFAFITSLSFLDWDENNRARFSVSLEAQRR